MRICAVIAAAGRGTRLESAQPKILQSLTRTQTVWSILHEKLSPLVDHVHLVLSPDGVANFPALPGNASFSIQPKAIGMGDAIFCGHATWSRYDAALVIWGDQVFVSEDSLRRTIATMKIPKHHAVLPLTRMDNPYVEYVFEDERLVTVRQLREGDTCTSGGLADIGTFLLGVEGLKAAWDHYLTQDHPGVRTGEVNFLPFLPYLAAQNWTLQPLEIRDSTEARGINTPDDLAFFQTLYTNAGGTS